MTEPEVHPKKYFVQIEVFGSIEKRSWSHGPKSSRRYFINEPKCPVRNPFDRIDGVVREEGIVEAPSPDPMSDEAIRYLQGEDMYQGTLSWQGNKASTKFNYDMKKDKR